MSPFDIIKTFNTKSKYVIGEDIEENDYEPWLTNRALSFMKDTCLFANEMNMASSLDKKLQHDFYWYGIPSGKRFGAWQKADKNDTVDLVSSYYGINKTVAAGYLKLLSEEQLDVIRNKMNKGGKNGGPK